MKGKEMKIVREGIKREEKRKKVCGEIIKSYN